MKAFITVFVTLGIFGSIVYCEEDNSNATSISSRYYCGPNAQYLTEAPSACDTACVSLMEPCQINNVLPPSGCYCWPGFARDSSNVCIPIPKCPSQQGRYCGPYEIYYVMGKAPSNCQITCATLGEVCTLQTFAPSSGCYCIPGYARNACGECIPQSKCFP